jgi:RNA polymerase sigma factor for flagellar operon FliA
MRGTLSTIDLESAWDRWTRDRDPRARTELVERYVPFVRYMAGRFGSQISPYLRPELYSLGLLGLLDALDKFDPEVGVRFETYAGTRIRGAMQDGIRRMSPLPRGAQQQTRCMIRSITPVDFQSALTARGVRLQDCLEDPDQPSVFAGIELLADHQELFEAVEALPDRERTVIRRHYYEGWYLKAIGDELGVTESRACQIHRRALKMLELSLLRRRAA